MKGGTRAVCYNYCAACLKTTSGGLDRITGHGDEIAEHHQETPKNMYMDLEKCALDPHKEKKLIQKAREAAMHVNTLGKLRRNESRSSEMKELAAQYGIFKGVHLSWGFGDVFDEYFGMVDSNGLPSGIGVKIYSDDTVYHGGWLEGKQHASEKGTWIRPDGSTYEGSWMGGKKHGFGTQTYPDGAKYKYALYRVECTMLNILQYKY